MILGGEDVLNKTLGTNTHDMPMKLTQDDQATSAPKAVRVSIKTAVWIVLKHRQLDIKYSLGNSAIHMKATCDASTSQRLGSAILCMVMNNVERAQNTRDGSPWPAYT